MLRTLAALSLAATPLLVAPAAGAASVTGVCPDGSMFIAPRAEAVPCPDAVEVDPNELPPIKPEYLPRPYGWEVFSRERDPNNPYNLIRERRRQQQREAEAGAPQASQPEGGSDTASPTGAGLTRPGPRGAPPDEPGARDLDLSEAEIRDLERIVELSQRRAPAAVHAADGAESRVRLARSRAFDARLRERRSGPAGPAVLFLAETDGARPFRGNLTFVQGHLAFHPSTGDSEQLGILRGRLGSGGSVLGYVVLPERVDLARPLDIYWDDRKITTTLEP